MIKRLIFTLAILLACVQSAMAYQIKILNNQGGTVTINKKAGTAEEGDLIKVFIRPESDLWILHQFSITRNDTEDIVEYEDYYDPNFKAYSFTMPASDVTITAIFVRLFYAITVSEPTQQGYATVDTERVSPSGTVTVTTYPNSGYRATGVNVVEANSGNQLTATAICENTYSFTIEDEDVTVTPTFETIPEHPIEAGNPEHGSITVEDSGYEGDMIYVYTKPERGFAAYKVTALADVGSDTPAEVEITCNGDNSYSFIMPACEKVTVNALFVLADYYVRFDERMEHGSVSEETTGDAHQMGDEVTLTITPDEDYVFKHITITDEDDNDVAYTWLTRGETLKFIMPYSDVKVSATFRYAVYPIEVIGSELGTVTPDVEAARVGQTVTLTIAPDLGCMLTDINVEAGYETHGGSSPHAPRKAAGVWYSQGDITLNQIDATHYSFELPERLFNNLTPNYTPDTKFRVTASFKDAGPRVIWCEGNSTLYFDFEVAPTSEPKAGDQYDGQTITEVWLTTNALPTAGTPRWNTDATHSVKKIVFTPAFANARPTRCYYWFKGLSSLKEIEGLEYLNTSLVTDMQYMFNDCYSLQTLNVNNFDVSKVTDATRMFFNCSALTRIYCDNTWNIPTTTAMFAYDDKLVGAVSYREKSVNDGSMANPVTGYFTSSHPITLNVTGDGTATAPAIGFPGQTITIATTQSDYSDIGSVTVTGNTSGNSIAVTAAGDNYTFTMPGEPVSIAVTFVTPEAIDAALWCESNTTLYFVKQSQSVLEGDTWDGQHINGRWYGEDVNDIGSNTPGWNGLRASATRVVIDESFAEARPKSCYMWFSMFDNLQSIEGLEHLNTSSVTNTNAMFFGCSSLTSLNLGGFDMTNVTNANRMLRACTSLTTIYCANTWAISNSEDMFFGCPNLVGAASYNAEATDATMANPLTGYFTTLSDINIAPTTLGTVTTDVTQAYTNATVTITATPANERVRISSITVTGDTTGKTIQATVGADYNVYTFVMPGESVTVTTTFNQVEFTLAEALQQDNGTALDLVEPLVVAAVIGNHAYVTDGDGLWARLDLEESDKVRAGDNIYHFDCVLGSRETAPTFTWQESGSIAFSHDDVNIDIVKVDLANSFDIPSPCQVVEFTGYYYNGELRGLQSSAQKGQSLTLDTEYSGDLSFVAGERVRVVCGVELKEAWNDSEATGAPRRARSSYEYDFQNLKGKVISAESIAKPTGITDINSDSADADNRWFSIDGRLLGTDRPTAPCIYIHGGHKVIVR